MENKIEFRSKEYEVKYENGIVSFKSKENIGWVSCQKEPLHNLDNNEVIPNIF